MSHNQPVELYVCMYWTKGSKFPDTQDKILNKPEMKKFVASLEFWQEGYVFQLLPFGSTKEFADAS